jgi:hypothetical protein
VLKNYPRPNGEVAGGDLPNAGTGTAVTDNYGADLGPDAINREGSVKGTGSDPAAQDKSRCEKGRA